MIPASLDPTGLITAALQAANQPQTLTSQSNQAASSSTPAPGAFWAGLLIPRTVAQGTALPKSGGIADPTQDWDPTFDSSSTSTAPGGVATFCGELLGPCALCDYGDMRFQLSFSCITAIQVPALLVFNTSSSNVADAAVQVKLNGKIYGFTSPSGASSSEVSFHSLTLPFVAGQNLLSVAKAFGTQDVMLWTSFLGAFATWVQMGAYN